jgi:hypothetical protein
VILIDIPKCLITLSGGISTIDETLINGIQSGQNWAILVTSQNDKVTIPATSVFYEAVGKTCPTDPTAGDSSAADDIFDGESADLDTHIDPASFKDWQFAQLSFDEEPGMIWRWWIWKVPTIIAITAPSKEGKPYDVRYWKIAFGIPTPDRIL